MISSKVAPSSGGRNFSTEGIVDPLPFIVLLSLNCSRFTPCLATVFAITIDRSYTLRS